MKNKFTIFLTDWKPRLTASFFAFLVSLSSAVGQIVIDLPDVSLLPNTSGQTFDVFVQNSGSAKTDVTGIALNIQTADGGPAAGGVIPAPTISFVDVLNNPIFASNNQGNQGGSVKPQVFAQETTTSNLGGTTTVSIPSGSTKIATVTIDTSGFSSGTYTMTLFQTFNGSTRFVDLTGDFGTARGLVLTDGSITIVPEPNASLAMGVVLLVLGGVLKLRRTKSLTSKAI